MRQPFPGYLALWDPTPRKDRDFDEVHIGDVGIVLEGQFRRLFNVTADRFKMFSGTQTPDNFVAIDFDPGQDIEIASTTACLTPPTAVFGDRLTCEELPRQERDSERPVKCASYLFLGTD